MLITIGKTYLFNFEERIRKEKVEQIHNRIENGDDSWLKDLLVFIEIPSYVASISDDSSKHGYFVKAETKVICEEAITDTYGRTINSGENKALFNFMKHICNYGKVPFGQFDTSILTFLIVFCHIIGCFWLIACGVLIYLMESALLTRNPCSKHLFVDRNSY